MSLIFSQCNVNIGILFSRWFVLPDIVHFNSSISNKTFRTLLNYIEESQTIPSLLTVKIKEVGSVTLRSGILKWIRMRMCFELKSSLKLMINNNDLLTHISMSAKMDIVFASVQEIIIIDCKRKNIHRLCMIINLVESLVSLNFVDKSSVLHPIDFNTDDLVESLSATIYKGENNLECGKCCLICVCK
jgi:hypothetical protein